ncbi:hypothetical protein [Streptomyces lycii]|uniref:MarR family transcriptional regulator n=1 Tax=Streptomyces lycii TaxID=2654337 RepID=A0ABQ7FAD3_9ACTN|nr:hypothetical protein [Streptomyces lycii]KAF4405363.1 hypothetical protein GCU69_30325 [Streptomyces lycii]
MLRHAIAPTRFYSQISNEIIRHPRLTSDAVRLLTWQLSLPAGAREPLSRTAERAGIGKVAFLRAKSQLKAEGYVHEWRRQRERGLWATEQLVSNVPLTPDEAAAVRDTSPPGAPAVRDAAPPVAPARGAAQAKAASPQAAPTGGNPAAGAPTHPPTGRHPQTNTGENTLHPPGSQAAEQPPAGHRPGPADRRIQQSDGSPSAARVPAQGPSAAQTSAAAHARPTAPAPDTVSASGGAPAPAMVPTAEPPASRATEARALVDDLPRLDPRLRVPRAMTAELTGLVARWLEAGHRAADVRYEILRGLPTGNGTVHRPGGLVRHLLRDVPPTPPTGDGPDQAPCPDTPPPAAHPATTGRRLSARLSRMRECAGDHVQARLFLPEADEHLCRECGSVSAAPAVGWSAVDRLDLLNSDVDGRAECAVR